MGSKVWASFKKRFCNTIYTYALIVIYIKVVQISYNVSVWSLMSRDLMGQLEIQNDKYVCIGTKTIHIFEI